MSVWGVSDGYRIPAFALDADRKEIRHVVRYGEDLDDIASRYGVTARAILDANPGIPNPQSIYPGHQLTIPPPPADGRDMTLLPGNEHAVQSNETMTTIAARYGVPTSYLIGGNPQIRNPDLIGVGQELRIPVLTRTATATGDTEQSIAVDGAVAATLEAQRNLQAVRDLAARGDGAARAELRDGYLQDKVIAAQAALKATVIAEIGTRTRALRTQSVVDQIGRDIAGRYADPAVQAVVSEAVGDYQAGREVDDALLRLRDARGSQDLHNAEVALSTAVSAEIQRYAGIDPSPAIVDRLGNKIMTRYANDPAAQALVRDSVATFRTAREVDAILDHAEAADTLRLKLERLSAGYVGASVDTRNRLMSDPRTAVIFDAAARYANEPLAQIPQEIQSAPDVHPHTNQALTRLEELTRGLDPQLVGRAVESVLPAYESVFQRFEEYPVFGMNGTQTAVVLADRVWAAPNGAQLVRRIVALGTTNALALTDPLSRGAGPAYLIELGREPGIAMPGGLSMLDASVEGVAQFRNGQLKGGVEDYLEHVDELSFLVKNGGAAMTPQQLDAAIAEYIKSKGPEWKAKLEELQSRLATDGALLLNQVQQLEAAVTHMPPDQRNTYRQRIAELLKDPVAQLAVSMALNQRRELTQGAAGQKMVETFAALGVTGSDNPLAVTLVSAYLRENVIQRAQVIDLSDPASLRKARAELTTALRDNRALADMLEITPEQLDKVADSLVQLVPQSPTAVDAFEYSNNVARNANNAFDQLDNVFGRDTPFNRGFRLSAVAIVGSGLVNAIDRYGDNPTLRNGLDVIVESARVGVDGAQLYAAMRSVPEGSGVSTLKAAGKFVHVLGAGLATIDTVNRLSRGDLLGAGLSAATAGGVAWGALGTSSLSGPIGFGIAAVATLGLFITDKIRQSGHYSRFETDTTAAFLEQAGFDEDAARVLIDQSGEGYSAVPLLMRYGELHGRSPSQTVAWINSIDEHRLAALRDNLHRTLDQIDGDISQFNRTADNDGFIIRDTKDRPWFAASGVARPQSATQLDAILGVLEIAVPA